ncbi:hypothetical protein FN846DRAFT_618190 [Sphaerosporella brunnea]|uniref:Uncharacterized protein n=1 Tax=Sphaerosporella brunnea TaxID=1250544 RepID=A0A5J5ECN3_9PEZI|nr:hypothetical protein FN846DRAFT_618190 [Sphaerosporella brunnea]
MADVLQYRQKSFLPRLAELEPTFVQWTFSELETNPDAGYTLVYPENLPPGVKPRVPITDDECSFNSKDGVHRGWVRNDHMPFYDKGSAFSQAWVLRAEVFHATMWAVARHPTTSCRDHHHTTLPKGQLKLLSGRFFPTEIWHTLIQRQKMGVSCSRVDGVVVRLSFSNVQRKQLHTLVL